MHLSRIKWYVSATGLYAIPSSQRLTSYPGRFLPDVVLCMKGACDNSLDVNALLTPLSLACDLAGTPISQSALQNAQQAASSLIISTTVTITQTGTNIDPTPVGPTTASGTQGIKTVTTTAPTASTTTAYTGLIPVTIVGTDSAGSTYTSITTEPGAISTFTTTNSAGSTATVVSTYTQAGSGAAGGAGVVVQTIISTNSAGSTYTTTQTSSASTSSGSGSGSGTGSNSISNTTTATTSIAAQKTTGSFATSQTSSSINPAITNSAPLSAASMEHPGRWLGLSVLLVVVGLWL